MGLVSEECGAADADQDVEDILGHQLPIGADRRPHADQGRITRSGRVERRGAGERAQLGRAPEPLLEVGLGHRRHTARHRIHDLLAPVDADHPDATRRQRRRGDAPHIP